MKRLPKFDLFMFAVTLFGCWTIDMLLSKPFTGLHFVITIVVATAYGFWAETWWKWLTKK